MQTYTNLIVTFLIGGIWHGAGWTFIFWGLLHGIAQVLFRIWKKTGILLPKLLAWLFTFLFVNFAWVLFRAASIHDSINIYKAMLCLNGLDFPSTLSQFFITQQWLPVLNADRSTLLFSITFSLIAFMSKNSQELCESVPPSYFWTISYSLLAVIGITGLTRISQFLYFQF